MSDVISTDQGELALILVGETSDEFLEAIGKHHGGCTYTLGACTGLSVCPD